MRFLLLVVKKFFKILSWICVAAIVVFIAVAAPLIGGCHPMIVLSGSMEPTYPVGSVVYYKACTFEELKAGDPITFKAGESLVTHRITKVNELSRTVNTKGDANPSEDPEPVEASRIVGRTLKINIPYLGYLVTFCRKPACLGAIAAVIIIDYLLDGLDSGQKGKKDEA